MNLKLSVLQCPVILPQTEIVVSLLTMDSLLNTNMTEETTSNLEVNFLIIEWFICYARASFLYSGFVDKVK